MSQRGEAVVAKDAVAVGLQEDEPQCFTIKPLMTVSLR